jgi:hypothetical protein
MLERALPIPQLALDQDFKTRGRADARDLIRGLWDRAKQLLRALVDFFASGGPMS